MGTRGWGGREEGKRRARRRCSDSFRSLGSRLFPPGLHSVADPNATAYFPRRAQCHLRTVVHRITSFLHRISSASALHTSYQQIQIQKTKALSIHRRYDTVELSLLSILRQPDFYWRSTVRVLTWTMIGRTPTHPPTTWGKTKLSVVDDIALASERCTGRARAARWP
jgi:hypothetical protein